MGVLTSGSWSIAGRTATGTTGKIHENTYISSKRRTVQLKLTSVSGTLPAASTLPLPGAGSIGLVRNLDRYILDNTFFASGTIGTAVSGTAVISYNATGNSIKFFRQPKGASATGVLTLGGALPLVTSANIKALTLYVTAMGW